MRQRDARVLIAILGVATILRVWGNGWGLPFTYHPDEHQYIDSAVAMLGGDLNPGRFNNPSLLKYMNLAWLWLVYGAGRIMGSWPDVAGFQANFAADPTWLYRLARTAFAGMGVVTVAVTGHAARRIYGMRTGLIAAALLAGAFLHVRDSHYAVSDVPAALWVALAVWLAVVLLDEHDDRSAARFLLLGGALTGWAIATKYSAAIVLLPIGLAWLLRPGAGVGVGASGDGDGDGDGDGRSYIDDDIGDDIGDESVARTTRARRDRRTVAAMARRLVHPAVFGAAILMAVAFLSAVPFAVLDRPAFWDDIATLARRGQEGFKGLAIDPSPGWIFYLKSLRWGLGAPLLGASIAGLVLAVRSRRRAGWVLAALPIVLWLWMGSQLLMFARFMIPALPPLMILAAMAVVKAAERMRPWLGRRSARTPSAGVLAAWLAAVVLAPSFVSAVRANVLLGRPDTRDLARAWVEAELAPGTRILLQSGGPELDEDGAFVVERIGTLDLPETPLEAWHAQGWDVLITQSHATDRRLLDAETDAAYQRYYGELESTLPVLATFAPGPGGGRPPFVYAQVYGPATDLWSLERPGPLIRIYRLGLTGAATDTP